MSSQKLQCVIHLESGRGGYTSNQICDTMGYTNFSIVNSTRNGICDSGGYDIYVIPQPMEKSEILPVVGMEKFVYPTVGEK